MFEKLKKRWKIQSNWEVLLIIAVFAITGSLSVYVKTPVFDWLEIDSDTSIWLRILLSILIITPSYQVILLIVGTALGQFRFFWEFEKKTFGRLIPKRRA